MSKESELRQHDDFKEIHEDDFHALVDFKASLGIKHTMESSLLDEETIATRTTMATPSPSSSRKRSVASSSRRSVQSNVSNLSPLEENDEDESPTPQKRRRLMSTQSSMTKTVVMEEDEEESDSDETET